jgi:hypothetical protein
MVGEVMANSPWWGNKYPRLACTPDNRWVSSSGDIMDFR